MRITILTYGSRGDVQPFLALAIGLQNAGHEVKLAAPHRFKGFVEAYGVPFLPLSGDPEVVSKRLNNAGVNPLAMVRAISDYIFSIADQVAREAFTACDQTDLIIHSFLFTTGGHSLARKLGIPDVSIQTFPIFAPTRAFPPVSMAGLPPGLLSYFFHWLTTQIFWHGGNIGFNRLRKADAQNFDLELHWPFNADGNRLRTPLLLAYSPTVVPRPDDWSAYHIHIPGYFFLDSLSTYQPPQVLTDFLSSGEPPVCVSFGSMINQDSGRIYQMVLDALGKMGNRAVILSGWGKLSGKQSSDVLDASGKTDNLPVVLSGQDNRSSEQSADILVMDAVPHDWLLPRCKAIIHHGGAGTTAAGLHSGIPNVVVSFAADQPFWGARVHAIGAGPQPLRIKKLTVEKLVASLVEADGEISRTGAQTAGRKIRDENGIRAAVTLIEEHATRWRNLKIRGF